MSPLKENDGNEGWGWLRGDEGEDIESVYTASEEDPTVPATPVEYDGSENPDRVIQREDKLGILRLREYLARPLIPPPSPPSWFSGNATECRDPSSSLPGRGATVTTNTQVQIRARSRN